MKSFWITIFVIFLILAAFCLSDSGSDPDPDGLGGSEDPPPIPPSPPTPKHETAIVAAPDGTVYLVEIASGKIHWSFSSGPSIYSSYQAHLSHEGKLNASAESDHIYVDCGEDWQLYLHGKGFEKVKLPLSIEEFIRRTPFVSAGSGIMLGSKRTAVYIVDAKTGKVVRTFRPDNFSSSDNQGADKTSILSVKEFNEWIMSDFTDLEAIEKPLYVTRTDYALKYTSMKTGKVLWYLMFANIEASYQCDGIESFLDGFSHEGGSDSANIDMKSPSNCQARPVVYRIRDRSSLESLFVPDKLPDAVEGGKMLSLPPADDLMLGLADKFSVFHPNHDKNMILALPSSKTEKFIAGVLQGIGAYEKNGSIDSDRLENLASWFGFIGFLSLIAAPLGYVGKRLAGRRGKLHKHQEDIKSQGPTPKKKKGRKTGIIKNGVIVNQRLTDTSPDNSLSVTNGIRESQINIRNAISNFSSSHESLTDGRKIGKLLVSNKEIAKGSNGTVVLEGIYDGRPVAVKRLVQTHHDVALKEIQNLIAADQHPNIVRWYGVEFDQDFVYLSLERCTCSLYDLISSYATSQNVLTTTHQNLNSSNKTTFQSQWCAGNDKYFELWKSSGYPSPSLLKLMRDVVQGLAHLHELGIVHRDLKPQNVLVIKDRSICGKLSDMGISKLLARDMSSLTKYVTGYGSSGWQAPEQLRHERQTRAVDLFSLGCVLFFCLTGGKHPFGENLERDINIINNRQDLFLIEHLPEATDLISSLLDPNPDLRPKPVEVLCHPFFWDSQTRVSFLRDASDRVELEDRKNESELLEAVETIEKVALGGKWDEKMDSAFINDLGRYRRYKFDSVRDLLRVIRNKLNHYGELSTEIQKLLGSVPEGFDSYFSARFPRLLIEVYKLIHRHCAGEESFRTYFRRETHFYFNPYSANPL